jgi:hypothetical protein
VIVGTERLGYPAPQQGWRRFLRWETQAELVFDDRPEEVTATCHLQPDERSPALCGHPWERLVTVPGDRAWADLADWQCERCAKKAAAE